MKEWNLYFNGKYANNLSLIVAEYPSIPLFTPNKEKISIDGRIDGDLYEDLGTYADRVFSVKFRVFKPLIDYWNKLDMINKWLFDIEDNRLIYDRDDRCLHVKNITVGDLAKSIKLYGEFTVTFTCEPYFYDLQENNVTVAKRTYIYNMGDLEATPMFKVYGKGNGEIYTKNEESNTFTIYDLNDYAIVDSKLLTVKDSLGNNLKSSGAFPTLATGNNTLNINSNITKMEVIYTNKYR